MSFIYNQFLIIKQSFFQWITWNSYMLIYVYVLYNPQGNVV